MSEDGFISGKQLRDAKELAYALGITLDEALIRLALGSSGAIRQKQASQYGYEFVDLNTIEIPQTILALVPETVARKYVIIPISLFDKRLRVAMNNAFDLGLIGKLQSITQHDVDPVVAPQQSIRAAINRHYGSNLN